MPEFWIWRTIGLILQMSLTKKGMDLNFPKNVATTHGFCFLGSSPMQLNYRVYLVIRHLYITFKRARVYKFEHSCTGYFFWEKTKSHSSHSHTKNWNTSKFTVESVPWWCFPYKLIWYTFPWKWSTILNHLIEKPWPICKYM